MVRLTFLGTANAFGHGGRRRSSYFLEGSTNWLIDASFDAPSGLRSIKKTIKDVDFIFLSHLHPDHYMALPQFSLENYYSIKSDKTIKVYGPLDTEQTIKAATELLYNEEVLKHIDHLFEFHEIGPDRKIEFGDYSLETYPAIHTGNARMQKFHFDDLKLGYTGDTEYEKDLFWKLMDSDFIITEATSFDHQIPYHTTCKELLEEDFPSDSKIFISHVGEDVIQNKEKIKPPLILSYDGMVLEL